MFVILIYDMNIKRVAKANKICKKYLFPIQKSVFEGNLRQSQLNKLKKDLEKIVEPTEDAICIYEFNSIRYSAKERIGLVNDICNNPFL